MISRHRKACGWALFALLAIPALACMLVIGCCEVLLAAGEATLAWILNEENWLAAYTEAIER